jgi:hypothetical protein
MWDFVAFHKSFSANMGKILEIPLETAAAR